MTRPLRILCAAVTAAVLFSAGSIQAREIPVPPPVTGPPERPAYKVPSIEKTGPGIYRIGEVVVNRQEKSVSFPAQVNMDSGMLEYLLVYRAGKTHESLLRTSITPYSLQVAFMLLGYEGTDRRIAGQGSAETPKGEAVRITLSSVGDRQITPLPVETWLINKSGQSSTDVNPLNWVFCGSFINQFGGFMSQETGSIIAIWHDPVAMIDNASPGGESNRIWYVKQGTVPPVGTPVTVTIKPAQ